MTSKEALEKISWRFPNDPDFQKYCKIIKKDLEVLEILKNKTVAIFLIPNCQSAYDYSMKTIGFKSLTDKEFMLIKEWLENYGN